MSIFLNINNFNNKIMLKIKLFGHVWLKLINMKLEGSSDLTLNRNLNREVPDIIL